MKHFSLLFANEKTRSDFYRRNSDKIASAVIKDINIAAVLEEIQKSIPDYPCEYLLFPPYDIDTQNLRKETAEEIYDSSALFDKLKKFATELYVLKQHRRNILDIKNKDARNHCFLCAVAEYCSALKYLEKITENASSRGLKGLHDLSVELLKQTEAGVCRQASALLSRVNEMLTVSLRFDLHDQYAKIEEVEEEPVSKRISFLAENLLGAKLDFSFSAVNNVQLSPLEEALLDVMKAREPAFFAELERFCEESKLFDFDRLIDLRDEILFFIGYIGFVKKYENAGFSFAFPKMTQGEVNLRGIYDISLAVKLGKPDLVVGNDAEMKKGDIFVVSGSNQGGKTTFLRAFGQSVFFAAQGLPVPAVDFCAPFCGLIATHFNRAENVGKSRLEDEVERVKSILAVATENSTVLFNECFVGTRRGDAVLLSEKAFAKLFEIGATCGFVTHFFELPLRDARLISFVAEVAEDGTESRTYRIVKRSPDGLAYAHGIATACGATYEQLLAETEK